MLVRPRWRSLGASGPSAGAPSEFPKQERHGVNFMTAMSRSGRTLFDNIVISLVSCEARALPVKSDMSNKV